MILSVGFLFTLNICLFACLKDLPINSTSILVDIFNKFDKKELEEDFDNINLIRPVGSVNLEKVGNYISKTLESAGWSVEYDRFTDSTPIGDKTFTNIIGTLDAKDEKEYYVLACHYDSKMMNNFYGSIDSAMPCAMILQIAKYLPSIKERLKAIKLFFLDGEEAFVDWTDTDSIYGARHLASELEKQVSTIDGVERTALSRIKLFILLDLLGGRGTVLKDFLIYKTNSYYSILVDIESAALQMNRLRSDFSQSNSRHFGITTPGMVQDDHIPFYQRNVPILHLIPVPFPMQWHKPDDNKSNIDFDESFDLLRIFATFIHKIIV